jgi:hypothetical protein
MGDQGRSGKARKGQERVKVRGDQGRSENVRKVQKRAGKVRIGEERSGNVSKGQ